MSAAPILSIFKNGELVQELPLDHECEIGRDPACVIRLDDRAISRSHAVLKPTQNGVQIVKKSTFGQILVNGADTTSVLAKPGDVISIGPYLLKLAGAQAAPVSEPVLAQEPQAMPEFQPEIETPKIEAEIGEFQVAQEVQELPVESQPFEEPKPEEINIEPANGEFVDSGIDFGSANAEPLQYSPTEPTQITSSVDSLNVALELVVGNSNLTTLPLEKDEVYIGRDAECDIVLDEKKASRKHAVIQRDGARFVLKDLDSANGIYVNGVKVKEHQLAHDDVIQIGETKIRFTASAAGVPMIPDDGPTVDSSLEPEPILGDAQSKILNLDPNQSVELGDRHLGQGGNEDIGPVWGGPVQKPEKQSLWQKFKSQDKKTRIRIIAIIALFFAALSQMNQETPKPVAQKPAATAPKTGAAGVFEALSPEQKKFVETQYQHGKTFYDSGEFDRGIQELKKIFPIVPDYKNAKELVKMAEDKKELQRRQEEERRKKEEEARNKSRLEQLLAETKEKMDQKKYDEAQKLFPEISTLDPENEQVSKWQAQIEQEREQERQAAEKKKAQVALNSEAWSAYRSAKRQKRPGGQCRQAIPALSQVKNIPSPDRRPASLAMKEIQSCQAEIKALRDPLLQQGKQLEQSGDLKGAYQAYHGVLKVDSGSDEARLGIDRVRETLHEKVRVPYTEAVVAESYSDFDTAFAKFKEVLAMSLPDDIYAERAQRKLERYYRMKAKGGE